MPDLELHTVVVLHQRRYERAYKFEAIPIEIWNWMGHSLEALKNLTLQKPIFVSEAIALDRGIQLAKELDSWRHLISKDSSTLMVNDVIAAFQELERRLEESDYSAHSCISISRRFRKFIINHFLMEGQAFLSKRLATSFKSQLKKVKNNSRELISDLPRPGRPPVGAIAYGTHAELKAATFSTLKDDLKEILRCCEDVLNRYESSLRHLSELEEMEISPETAQRIKSKSTRSTRGKPPEKWCQEDLKIYLSLLKKGEIAASANRDKNDKKKRFHPLGAKELLVAELHGMANGAHIKELMQLDVAPPSDVLLACALILQIHTHWNFISVLELTLPDVKITKFPHRLQSVKPRSSDETPIVFVERSDELVICAMSNLVNRWERLVKAGMIDKENKNLWFSAWFLKGGPPQPVVSWGAELREFTSAYKLPPFTLEQVRVQCLALIATTKRGLGGTTQAAGHVAGNTTLRYIDKALLNRLNSSNLLEFERRLETTIHYEMGKLTNRRRLAMLSLGNGAECSAPHSPPNPSWLYAGVCAGEMCHQGDGCPNRMIVIDSARLEEIVRSKNYYSSNWMRLADENFVRFERVHAPQMLFSLALYGVIKRGPYRHIVARFEK